MVKFAGLMRSPFAAALSLSLAAGSPCAWAQAPIVQPGLPGAAPRTIDAIAARRIADTRYTADDVRFMQDMIIHHQQAVDMAALVAPRAQAREIAAIAKRINAAQADEMNFMRNWLVSRNEPLSAEGAGHDDHAAHRMKGMASAQEMKALAAAKGIDFDRLFLTLMIKHHKGAVDMVEALLDSQGSAYDPALYEFVTEVSNGQSAEIDRMDKTLAQLSPDPRIALKGGFRDAGEAIAGLEMLASLERPPGFFDPANPTGIRPPKPKKGGEKAANKGDEKSELSDRSPLLNFVNTDIAFSGDLMVVGNCHGFNIYRLGANGLPTLMSSVVCPGGQGDVSIVGDLLIMSVEERRGRADCGLEGVTGDISAERFRGVRIFNIGDPSKPMQVGQVQTCRGSHTHSVVSGPGKDGKIIVYSSGTSSVRDEKELAGCVGNVPGDGRTAFFRIDVIEIPVADPSRARIIDRPTVFVDPVTGRLGGLWQGGDHGEGTQTTSRTDECHDITVFPSRKIAAGACSGNGVVFDISDPRKPRRIDEVGDPGFAYWHSATFNNDGTKILYTDEWGGGTRPRCRAIDPQTWGADAIYDIVDGKLEFGGYYKLAAPQTEEENCVAHNGSIIPVPGRDIFVQAWYQGGVSVIDFTDSAKPFEIAYFDRGPVNKDHLLLAGYWSSYWFKGRIYASEIVRGIDVFKLAPTDFLSANEIAAAMIATGGDTFNAQQQFPMEWPAAPVVARAFLDQLKRDGAINDAAFAGANALLARADGALEKGGADKALAAELAALSGSFRASKTGSVSKTGAGAGDVVQKRRAALAKTIDGVAARLR